jgi:hypothetical protein
MAHRRLRQPDARGGATHMGFGHQRIERDQEVEVERGQIHATNIDHPVNRLEE